MMFEPWTECPPLDAWHRYIGRMNAADGVALGGIYARWPERGYMEAKNWTGAEFDPQWPNDSHGGLWGYLNCTGVWFEPVSFGCEQLVIAVIDTREACFHIDDTVRAPRAWVKFSGTVDEVVEQMRAEGGTYNNACIRFIENGLAEGKRLLFQLHERTEKVIAEAAAGNRARQRQIERARYKMPAYFNQAAVDPETHGGAALFKLQRLMSEQSK